MALARSIAHVLAGVRRHRPRVVVLVAPLASPRSLILLDALSGAPRTRVLVIARARSSGATVDAMIRGARGHLGPSRVRERLAAAVRAVARGDAWCSRQVVPAFVVRLTRDDEANGRAARET